MPLAYGFVKAKMISLPRLQSKPVHHDNMDEVQYHLHFTLDVDGADWDIAANVGTDNAVDLLKYKIVQNFHHPIVETLRTAPPGKSILSGTNALPALDFLRSTILDDTGGWQESDVLDGSPGQEPPTRLNALLSKAFDNKIGVYVFGRFYTDGNGVHDVHMNQGSRDRYIHRAGDDRNDHNDIWQDGALMLDLGVAGWVAYFSAFMQQTVPTDELGNPVSGGHTI